MSQVRVPTPAQDQIVTRPELASECLYETERRLRKQNHALTELTKVRAIEQGDVRAALQHITEVAANTLEVDRASAWLYDETQSKIRSHNLFERSRQRHSDGAELNAGDFPSYFEALERDEVIDASDANADPRTSEFSESYLLPLGINLMLDIPIRLGGRMIGVVCQEHIGPKRDWTLDEQSFARAIGDLISLAISSAQRKQAEDALRRSEKLYRTLAENFPNGAVLLFDLDLGATLVEGTGLAAAGFPKQEVEGKTIWEVLPPETCQSLLPNLKATLAGERKSFEITLGDRICGVRTLPLRDDAGEVCGGMAMTQDVSVQKRVEEQLRASEIRYRAFVAQSSEAIWRIESEVPVSQDSSEEEHFLHYSYLAECNDAMARMYGYKSADDCPRERKRTII